MMNILAPIAKANGYFPDSIVTSSCVPNGRPYPWMAYKNAMNLGIFPMNHFVKVGDTIADIEEGINSNMWSVGVIKGGSVLGLTSEEVESMESEKL